MAGTSTVGGVAVPISFEFVEFAAGRAQVSLATAAKVAPLFTALNRSLLDTLAARADRYAS
jgi:hypothetical protein